MRRVVFLSSTGADLQPYRDAVSKVIRRAGWERVGMEDFTAQPGITTHDYCRKTAQECDVFVGLLGHCYGSIPPMDELSYTEQEYQAAGEAGIPRLMFLAPSDFKVEARLLLDQPHGHAEKQKAFRDRAAGEQHQGQPDAFVSPDALGANVVAAIHQMQYKQPVGTVGEETMGMSPPPPGSPAQLVGRLNRVRQETSIKERLNTLWRSEGSLEPLLVILPGELKDGHRRFVERFVSQDLMGYLSNDEKPACVEVRWPEGGTDLLSIMGHLGDRLSLPHVRSVKDFANSLSAYPRSVFFYHLVNCDAWMADRGNLLRQWLTYFVEAWPPPGPRTVVIGFVCLCLPEKGDRWFSMKSLLHRIQYRHLFAEVVKLRVLSEKRLLVTDKLDPINESHLQEWVGTIEAYLHDPLDSSRILEKARNTLKHHRSQCPFEDIYNDLLAALREFQWTNQGVVRR